MGTNLRTLAAAGVFFCTLWASDTALAQKSGGVLKVYFFDSPASMSIHEEATIAAEGPMMGVFNNLVMYKQDAKIRQGVTTEVVGNCGFSVAPTLPGKAELLAHYLSASAPWLPFIETDFAGYMAAWPAIAVNTVMQVGHNTLRLMAMGMENRAPSERELLHMQEMLAEALDAGSIGMSSGLFTPPGLYAEPEEIRALGHVLKRHGA